MNQHDRFEVSEEIIRINDAEKSADKSLRESIGRLDKVVKTAGHVEFSFEANPNSGAVFNVLKQYGYDPLNQEINVERLSKSQSLDESARLFGTRLRNIILPTQWWKKDHGHFIAYLKPSEVDVNSSDAEPDYIPVSVICKRAGYYELIIPGNTSHIRVNQKIAERLAPTAFEAFPPLPNKLESLTTLAKFILPTIRSELYVVMFVGAVIGLLGAVFPIATGFIIDSIIPSAQLNLLTQLGIVLAILALLNYIFSLLSSKTMLRINGRTSVILQSSLWDRVLKLPISFFRTMSSGDLQARISGMEALRESVITIVLSSSITTFFSLFYLGLLFVYDPRLALLAIGIVTIQMILSFSVALYLNKFHRRQAEISGWISGYVFQVLQAIVKLRVAGAEKRALTRWANKYADENAATLTTVRIAGRFDGFMQLYSTLAMALIFAATNYLTTSNLSAGMFIAFIAAFGGFQSAFLGLSGAILTLVNAMPEWQRAKAFLSAETERTGAATDPGGLSGSIDLTNIDFAYDGGAPVLQDVSLTVEAGQSIALVGSSGSGKSTIIKIMLGLEKPESGTVTYDSQDLQSLDLKLVRQQIGVVTQNGRLSAGSIMDNIRGATIATHEECLEACIASGLEDDLKSFPMGLHTPLTEGASTLSGGQRQRLLIARALVNKPKILIFDEATSALDNKTQAIVTASLDRLNVTRIIVAHRLSTIQNADRIYVLDQGRVVENGTYKELVKQKGLFEDLVKRQIV